MYFTISNGLPSTILCSFSFISIFRIFSDICENLFFQINFITTFLALGKKMSQLFRSVPLYTKHFFCSVSKTGDTPYSMSNVLVT